MERCVLNRCICLELNLYNGYQKLTRIDWIGERLNIPVTFSPVFFYSVYFNLFFSFCFSCLPFYLHEYCSRFPLLLLASLGNLFHYSHCSLSFLLFYLLNLSVSSLSLYFSLFTLLPFSLYLFFLFIFFYIISSSFLFYIYIFLLIFSFSEYFSFFLFSVYFYFFNLRLFP